jgi:hypothetical protein
VLRLRLHPCECRSLYRGLWRPRPRRHDHVPPLSTPNFNSHLPPCLRATPANQRKAYPTRLPFCSGLAVTRSSTLILRAPGGARPVALRDHRYPRSRKTGGERRHFSSIDRCSLPPAALMTRTVAAFSPSGEALHLRFSSNGLSPIPNPATSPSFRRAKATQKPHHGLLFGHN